MAPPVTEGSAPFHVPGADKPCATYYKVVGDIKSGTTRPLVVLHGGPGFAHDYLLPLADLAAPPYNVPVVFYDQFGGGRSTHLPEKNGDTGFWTEQLFEDEFFNLLAHLGIEEYDVLGHSWGGMLGARIAVHHPRGLRRLVLSDTLAKMEAWAESGLKLLRKLPQDIQDVVEKHEKAGTTNDPEYEAAIMMFYKKFVLQVDPWPPEFLRVLEMQGQDPTVSHTMFGPLDFCVVGSLKKWDITPELHKIAVPTLLINGRFEQAADEVVSPLFWNIPNVRWYTFPQSSHMPYWEEREAYMKFVMEFLGQK